MGCASCPVLQMLQTGAHLTLSCPVEQVLKGLVKKPGKLRKVRLFCSSFSTAGMLQGGSTGAQQHLHEVCTWDRVQLQMCINTPALA